MRGGRGGEGKSHTDLIAEKKDIPGPAPFDFGDTRKGRGVVKKLV